MQVVCYAVRQGRVCRGFNNSWTGGCQRYLGLADVNAPKAHSGMLLEM